MRKIGAEVILTVIITPFLLWVVNSIYTLQASSGTDQIKIEQIKQMLEKQDQKLENITNILINREK